MITIRLSPSESVAVPNSWDELSPEQCEYVLRQRIAADEALVVKFLYKFYSSVPWSKMEQEQLERIILELQVFKGEPSFTVGIFKTFTLGGIAYQLPTSMLENFTLERYASAEKAIQTMLNGGDEVAAFAYLLSPCNARTFDIEIKSVRESAAALLAEWEKVYLLCLFLGCSKGLRNHFPETFKKQQGKGKSALARFGWLNVFFGLAKLPQYTSIEQVRQQPLLQALAVLEWEAVQAAEQQQANKK